MLGWAGGCTKCSTLPCARRDPRSAPPPQVLAWERDRGPAADRQVYRVWEQELAHLLGP